MQWMQAFGLAERRFTDRLVGHDRWRWALICGELSPGQEPSRSSAFSKHTIPPEINSNDFGWFWN